MQRLSQNKSGSLVLRLGYRSQARESARLEKRLSEFGLTRFYRIVSGCVRIDGLWCA